MNDPSSNLPSDLNGSQHALSTTYPQADNLLATQQLLRATLDSSMDMIQVFVAVRNPQGEIIDFTWVLNNHAAQNIYGDVVGKSLLHLQPGVVEEGIFAVFTNVVQTGLPQHYEKHYVHEQFDGWFHQSVVKLNDGVATTTADITARKRAQQQLQQSNELLQQVIDAPSIGIAVYKAIRDEQGHITDFVHEFINRASVQMLGGEEFTGRPFSDHGENAHRQMPQFIDAIETATANRYVREAPLRGHTYWFAITNTPVAGDRLVHTWEDVTERVRAEREILRLNEEAAQKVDDKYHAIFNAIDEGFCIQELRYDDRGQLVDLRTTEANPACERQTGFTKDVIGRWHSEFGLTTDRVWFDSYDRVAKTGEPETVEHWHELSSRWYQASLSRIGEAGSRQLAVVFNDITERKQREQQQAFLLTLGDKLRPLSDPVAIEGEVAQLLRAHFDAGWCYYVEWDEATQLGVVRRDATRKGLASLIGEHDVSDVPEFLALLKANPLLAVSDYKHYERLTPALRQRYTALGFSSMLVATLVKQERLVASLIIGDTKIREWSTQEQALLMRVAERTWAAVERARSEVALQQSQQQLSAIIHQATAGIARTDPDGTFTFVNEQYGQQLGYAAAELLGRKMQAFTHLDDLACNQALFERLNQNGQPFEIDKRYIRQDGSLLWVHNHVSALRNPAGEITQLLAVSVDITARKQAEEALQQADRRKDEFLAMLAHELRNPMATLRAGLTILDLTITDKSTRSTATMMSRQTDHLVRMVDDLLDVSRISRGKIELKTERVNLVAVVSQAADSVGSFYQAQGKHLHLDLPTASIELAGDATRLTQVVTNLLTNGARYTGEQGQVWLTLAQRAQEAILQVRDNGIGLPADQLSTIFELFVQVDNSTARSKGGLGLGLTLVKRLAELHGGRVAAHSDGLGQGSTFTIYLPTLAPAANPTPLSSVPQAPDSATTQRILVIDDNADAALMMTMLLKLKGYETHSRNSGRAGIEAAERWQPAAILLDIGMPDLDGYTTCGLIRQQAWGESMVIIALTGYGQQEDRQRTKEAGFDGHLVKPVELDTLTQLLTDLLDKKQN